MLECIDGSLTNASDAAVPANTYLEKRTLVTYDCRTMPPTLKTLAEFGQRHGGVLLINERTLLFNDFGWLVSARRGSAQRTWPAFGKTESPS